ncbi:MAG: hypothetical protein HGA80_06210 [Candidatus Omnitrophica bacterium]|nr:hypothetical protein [Candidatus Omnitrophota bacterium]
MENNQQKVSLSDRVAIPTLFVLSAIVFLLLLCLGWQRWADVLIDFGRELYVPWRIAQGQVLYKDIFYLYGPLAAYWNAFLFKLFGTHALTLWLFDLLLLGYLTVLLHRLVALMSCRLTAAFAVLAFTAFFSLAHYSWVGNYNYLAPYSHALVYGLVLVLTMLLALYRSATCPGGGAMFLPGFLAGLALWTKLEPAAAMCGALLIALVVRCVRPMGAGFIRRAGAFAGGFILPFAVCVVFFCNVLGIKAGWEALMSPLKAALAPGVIGNPFVRDMSGMGDVYGSLRQLAWVSLGYATVILGALIAALLVSRVKTEVGRRWARLAAVVGFLLCFSVASRRMDWNVVFLPLPIFCLLFIGVSLLWKREAVDSHQWTLLRMAFGCFALLLPGKILLQTHIYHYGFVLALPAFMAMLIFLMHDVPALLPKARFDARTFQVIMGGLLVALACVHIGFSLQQYSFKTYLMGTDRGRFRTFAATSFAVGPVLDEIMTYLRSNARPGETLVVMPEGVMLNFLLGMPNPTPYYDFIPTTIALASEEVMLQSLQEHPPEYVVYLERDMSEYGARYLGRDYARTIGRWVDSRYRLVFQSGVPPSTGQGFGAIVLRRED